MDAFRSLVKSPGWERLVEIADAQQKARQAALMGPAEGMDGMIKNEGLKGEFAGIKLFVQMPEAVIENLEQKQKTITHNLRRQAS